MFQKIKTHLAKLKQTNPLILNITNDVTMDFIANGLLSIGASPIMSKAPQEIDELVRIANAIVINIGTLDDAFIQLCEQTCETANRLKKPIILDPVGAGASRYRTDTCLKLLNNYDIAIVRGNASEVMSLAGEMYATKGVDSLVKSHFALASAQLLSERHDVAVMVSGETDVIVDGENIDEYHYGSSLMPQVTGTGCLLSSVVAAFHAIEVNRYEACALAAVFYSICGENAAKHCSNPASFKVSFLNELNIAPNDFNDER